MSQITCCPACTTMFRVVPDQLRISEGWVRCGHCAEVFDATAHLQVASPFAHDDAPAQEFQETQAPQFDAPPPVEAEPPVASPTPYAPPPLAPVPRMDVVAVVDEAALAFAESLPASLTPAPPEPPLYPPFSLLRADGSAAEPELSPPLTAPSPAALAPTPRSPDDVSFVRQARRKALWRRPGVRVILFLLVVMLGSVLAAQLAVFDRDRLASREPSLRPWLEAACAQLGCTVGAPRQIDALVIDSSSFSRLRGDAYRLSFTLKNQAALAVAMPAIELTLTDAQDQPVVRRVLLPAEFAASASVVGAASEWAGTLAMSVPSSSGAGRIAGYRMLAFYP